MRKRVFGKQLKRDKNERKALFKTLLSSLVMYETIKTTEAKAKAIKPTAEKLITKAKKGGLHAYRLVEPELSTEAVKKLINSIAPRFASRQGGYTRIMRAGRRVKDNSQEVIIEWTERASQIETARSTKPEKKVVKENKNPIGKIAERINKKTEKGKAAKKLSAGKPSANTRIMSRKGEK
jgi:large subunit ribosomal protein L17